MTNSTEEKPESFWKRLFDSRGRLFPAALLTVPLVPILAAALTVLTYIIWQKEWALLIGALAAGGIWLLLVPFGFRAGTVDRANVRTYGDFIGRLKRLDKLIGYPKCPPSTDHLGAHTDARRVQNALNEAWAYRKFIEKERGKQDLRWVRAHGYNNLWIALHSAEEALLEAEDEADSVREGLGDEARLVGSQIPNSPKLLNRLRGALHVLDTSADQYFFDPAPSTDVPADKVLARGVLRETRATINQFNDTRYDAIARTRNSLLDMVPFGGLAVYLILGIAVLELVKVRYVEAAAVFYVSGVLAGLLATWYAELKAEATIQTFGLASARLYHALVFSGAAAIAGVVLYEILSGALGVDLSPQVASSDSATTAGVVAMSTGSTASSGIPPLSSIFDIDKNLFGVFVAFLFGAAPELILSTLKLYGERFIEAVKSTSSAQG